MLPVQPGEPLHLPRTDPVGVCPLDHAQVRVPVPAAKTWPLAGLVELLAAELPDRVQHPVADLVDVPFPDQDRLVDQVREDRRHVGDVQAVPGADLFGGVQPEASGEHREARPQKLLLRPSTDRGSTRCRSAASAAGSGPDCAGSSTGAGGRTAWRAPPSPRRRAPALRRARSPAAARRVAGRSRRPRSRLLLGEAVVAHHGGGPVDEELHGAVLEQVATVELVGGSGSPSGATGMMTSPAMPSHSRLVVRIRSVRAGLQQRVGELGDRVDEVLGVVQHEQAAAARPGSRSASRAARGRTAPAGRPRRRPCSRRAPGRSPGPARPGPCRRGSSGVRRWPPRAPGGSCPRRRGRSGSPGETWRATA